MSLSAELEHGFNDTVGVLNSQNAVLVDQVARLLSDERLWAGDGMTSMSHWVAWRAGVSPATASAIVAIAERVDDLPESVAVFRRGELSLDQMATIARNAPSWTDVQSRDYATVMTVNQLRHVLRKYPFPELDADGREVGGQVDSAANPQKNDEIDEPVAPTTSSNDDAASPSDASACDIDEFLSMSQDDDGSFRLAGRFSAEAGMVVRSALDEVRDRLFQRGEFDVGLAQALHEMAQSSLDSIADPARRSRFRVNLFINADRNGRGMVDATGWNVPDAIRRWITCDGMVTPVFLEGGLPVSVGRSQYVVPIRTPPSSNIEITASVACLAAMRRSASRCIT